MRFLSFIAIALSLFASPVFGHESTATRAEIALDEQLGSVLPGDAVFRDETGTRVNLKELADRPVIIAPVYLSCMHECPLLLTGLAEALGRLELVSPGRDFRVVALSFDEQDTPAVAADKKKDYLKAIRRPFPAEAWTFLTGDAANIRKFTDAIGFTFQRDGRDFSHPLAVVVLAPGGKVTRYLYGVTFLPFNITMAVTEASEGKIGTTAGRVLNYCFSYDPLEKSYVFNVLKVTGTVMVLFAVSFFVYLMVSTKKHPRAV